MSEEMVLSICKAAAFGETAEKTGEVYGIAAAEVKDIWNKNADIILEYQNFQKEMGCSQ